jgi:hypothetical protein
VAADSFDFLLENWPYALQRLLMHQLVGRDSLVGIETGYGLDGQRIETQWGARFYAPVQTGSGAHPVSYTMGTGSFPGVKRSGRGVDH